MKQLIKKILKAFVPARLKRYLRHCRKVRKLYGIGYVDILRRVHIVRFIKEMERSGDYVRQMGLMFKKLHINKDSFYIYPYDVCVLRQIPNSVSNICSITVDYSTVLESSLAELAQTLVGNTAFENHEQQVIKHIRLMVDRIKDKLGNSSREIELKHYFERMTDTRPASLDEAIQKLLFYNALFWQMRHYHNGLGRLDMILAPYYEQDREKGKITREGAKQLLRETCLCLNRDMRAKSMSLYGDTGQYILLGGIDVEGKNIHNDLTEIFLELFTEMKLPDPKLILRVNDLTDDIIWRKAIECISTGCGSPLLMNETLIMDGMRKFGYNENDVWNVGTSACWEPLIIGKSFDQNNPLPNIPIITSLNKVLYRGKDYETFESLLNDCKTEIKNQIANSVHDIQFDVSPLYSLFFDDCIKEKKDYTLGGARYAYHGVQIVSFPNLVNSLLNLKMLVFERKAYTLEDCVEALRKNFEGEDTLLFAIRHNDLQFGSTNKEVVDLTNGLMLFISNVVDELTLNGKKVKVGFSSPSYISASRKVNATFDGRKDKEPFAVHISPVSKNIDIQEVIDFASMLDYSGNRLNGNVVDFILPSSFVAQPDKLRIILKNAIHKGIFELQLNVLDAETLKDAKLHPEKYPNLVVRVWGFSAYFNELPEDYKDNLIKRAEAYA